MLRFVTSLALLVSFEWTVRAAPPTDDNAPAAPPGAQPNAALPESREACILRRREIAARARTISDIDERSRQLLAMPTCTRDDALVHAPMETTESAMTYETSAGLAIFSLAGASFTRFGGLDLGIGGFVSPRVAIGARIAGGTIYADGVVAFVGVGGPHVQVWLDDHIWVGGGGGFGFVGAIGSRDTGPGIAGVLGSGLDFRAGYSFGGHGNSANLSIEACSLSDGLSFAAPFSDNAVTVLSFMIGYQSGGPPRSRVSEPGRAPEREPTAADRASIRASQLIAAARTAARRGDCAPAARVEREVRTLDPALIDALHADEAVAACLASPAATPTVSSPPTPEVDLAPSPPIDVPPPSHASPPIEPSPSTPQVVLAPSRPVDAPTRPSRPAPPVGPSPARPLARATVRHDDEDSTASRNRRWLAAGVAGVGVLGLGVAVVAGVDARANRDDARSMGCSADLAACPAGALATAQTAYSRGNLSTGVWIGGTIAIGAGVVLWLTAPDEEPATRTAWRVVPALGPDRGGLVVTGGF